MRARTVLVMPRRTFVAVVAAIASVCLTDCAENPVRPSSQSRTGGETILKALACNSDCDLATDLRPFLSARARSDSASIPIRLAEFAVQGTPGDSIVLSLDTEIESTAFGGATKILVEVEGSRQELALSTLLAGATVYRFSRTEEVRVKYSISRTVAFIPEGTVKISQHLSPRASLTSGYTPWINLPAVMRRTRQISDTHRSVSAVIVNQPGNYDATAIDIDPFAAGEAFGGFQSDPGQGASNTMYVTFTSPLSDSLTLTILDPDYPGNMVRATFADGHHETHNFAGDNTPGVFTSESVSFGAGVSSLSLVPAGADYVAYSLEYGAAGIGLDCGATGTLFIRGNDISCTAVKSGTGGTLAVTGWSFTNPTLGINIVRGGGSTALSWSGPIVVEGTIQVSGTIGGSPSTATVAVQVIPRNWTMSLAKTINVIPPSDPAYSLPEIPSGFNGQFGVTASHLGIKQGQDFLNSFVTIADGPNTGLVYFASIPAEVTHSIQINTVAMSTGSAFYNMQEPTTRVIGGRTFCSRDFLTRTLPPLVEAHEGTTAQKKSHVGIFQSKAEELARREFEKLVILDPLNGFKQQFDSVSEVINAAATADSKAMDTDSRNNLNLGSVPCEFHY